MACVCEADRQRRWLVAWLQAAGNLEVMMKASLLCSKLCVNKEGEHGSPQGE